MGKIGHNTVISDDATLGQDVIIGNNVTIYQGVTIGDGSIVMDGAVLGRRPISTGNTTRPIGNAAQPLSIGRHCVIGANTVLYWGITIGDEVLIGDLASIREGCQIDSQAVVGRGVLVMYETCIGQRSRVIDGTILTGNMVIEEDVFIGPGVKSSNDNDVYLKRFGLAAFSVQGPFIRRFAMVGTGANLNAGIEIGVGCIVAPSAMVIHNVDPWTVVAGVPAQLVRIVDNESRRRILEKFELEPDFGAKTT
jgi:acetyltransferase-like isoleucine patch superfamily enzyme